MKTTPKKRSEPAPRRTYLFDATGEAPADTRHPRAVLRWLLDVAARRGVGHRATRLLCGLEAHTDDDGRCFPSVETLGGLLGIADPNSTHVYRDLALLMDAGLVEKRRDGTRLNRYVLRPAAYRDTSETDVSTRPNRTYPHVRNGRTDTSETDTGSTQPKTQKKEPHKTQPGRGSSSAGSGRVQNGGTGTSTERPASASTTSPARNPRDAAVRERLRQMREDRALDSGGPRRRTGDELVETARALGFKALGLLKQRLKERGLPWMRDLIAAAERARRPCGFLGTYLKAPDTFERPESVPYDRPAPERYGGDYDFDGKPRRRRAVRRVADDGDGIRDLTDILDRDEDDDEDDHD